MSRFVSCVMAVLLLGTALLAEQKPAPADRIEQLKAKADSASDHDKCYAYAELIAELVRRVDEQSSANDIDHALETSKQIPDYADRCKEAATKSKHKLKNSEIVLRKAERRLDDIAHTLSVTDQPVLKSAVDHIEQARTQILLEMFKR